MGDEFEILNTTRYDSDDLWNCIRGLIPATQSILYARVRYLMKPTRQASRTLPRDDSTWAVVERSGRERTRLDIALLHPDRLALPALVMLARAGSGESGFAHPQIVTDLIDETACVFRTPKLAIANKAMNPKIELRETVDPAAKKLATFRTFKEKVENRQTTILSKKGTLAYAHHRRDEAQQQIDHLQKKIPELEARQIKLEEELERRAAKLPES